MSRSGRCLLAVTSSSTGREYFKRFNDDFGHAVGDQVLTLVANTVEKSLRPTDLAARYGGEELVVILPETPLDGARIAASRVRASIGVSKLASVSRQVTSSIGVATLVEGVSADHLLKRADERLYLAKERGRNRVES